MADRQPKLYIIVPEGYPPGIPRWDFDEGDPLAKLPSGFPAPLAKPRWYFDEGDPLAKACWYFDEGDPLAKLLSGFPAPLAKLRWYFDEGDPLAKLPSGFPAPLAKLRWYFDEDDPLAKLPSGFPAPLAKARWYFDEGELSAKLLRGFPEDYPMPELLLLAKYHWRFYVLSNQGESSGSGGRAGEERNGGPDRNHGIGGGVGGGGQREIIGNERTGSRGRSHGGGNGDDDDNRRGWVGYIEDERRPTGPRPDRMAEILLPFNFQMFATVESLEITGLSVRVRIVRVVSLGFTSVALVCLSASIRQRGTNPRLASILTWIGSVATFLGFISMIAMALLASFIP